MEPRRSPTTRLLAGLGVTLTAVALYSAYTIQQLRGLEELQTQTIDRNRADSLLLLRIQNNLGGLGLALRDMLDSTEPYPLTAWQSQFRRIRTDLEDALTQETGHAPPGRSPEQQKYLASSFAQFWDSLDRIFALAADGREPEARAQIRLSQQARLEALVGNVARLLVQNNEAQQDAAARTRAVYRRVARNAYVFLAAIIVLIVLTSLYVAQSNRRMFAQVAELSERRKELTQQLLSLQENTLRSISRELHDDFGQILTAIGVMLQRAERKSPQDPAATRAALREVEEIVQSALEKVRSLSRALHPVALEEMGFENALDQYLPGFEKRTGIEIRCEKEGVPRAIDGSVAIHLYRVMQESLSNIARHSRSTRASVRLRYRPEAVVLEVEDNGVGFGAGEKQGMGLLSMRERAELVNGRVEFLNREAGGALVRLTIPLAPEGTHAGI